MVLTPLYFHELTLTWESGNLHKSLIKEDIDLEFLCFSPFTVFNKARVISTPSNLARIFMTDEHVVWYTKSSI